MNEEQVIELFSEMRNTIVSKSVYHQNKREFYEAKHHTPTLNIAMSRNLDRKLNTQIGWGRTAVDKLLSDVEFDGFKNDTLGFTRLLLENNSLPAIESAQKNSMIGACSFVSVLPDEHGNPFFNSYTGAEATGIYDSRRGLIAGLVSNGKKKINDLTVGEEFLLFTEGVIYKIGGNGKIQSVVEMPTNRLLLVPFIYDQDIATNPFGSSRFNNAFTTAMETAVREIKLLEIGNDVGISSRNILLTDADINNFEDAEVDGGMDTMKILFRDQGTDAQLVALEAPDVDAAIDTIGIAAANAANAVQMKATDFGFQPSNGSFSAETIQEMDKPYRSLVGKTRNSYGRSIKELAISAMSLASGQYYREWEDIVPVFKDEVDIAKLGSIADGIQKLSLAVPDADFTEFINQKILSGNVREEAMKVTLPNFAESKKNAERAKYIKSDITNVII